MKITLPALLLCGLVLVSCQSMSSGVFSLEARANVLDDAEIDAGASTADVDVEAYGLHAALMTPIVDVLGGIETRDYEAGDGRELILGARRRMFEIWRFHPFVEVSLRYGFDSDEGFDDQDYFGWQAGAGVLFDVTDNIFLNARLMYEMTEVDVPGGGTADIDGLVGTIGVGLSF